MKSGRMDTKIVIEVATETRTSSGAITKTWSTFESVWAQKIDSGSREYFNNATIGEFITVFKIYYLRGLTLKMRVKYNDEYYDIKGIKELGRKEGYELTTVKQDHGYNT